MSADLEATSPGAPGAGRAVPRPHALEISGLTKTFGTSIVLKKVGLTVAAGEVHALLGENGSGKSTLIKLLAGVHQPDSGQVMVGGQELQVGSAESAYALGCRFVHQDLGLVGNLSVADNLFLRSGFPSRFGTVRGSRHRALARAELDRLQLDISPDTLIDQLSPAQRSGVAVVRALINRDGAPVHLIVFDEPTATLPEVEVARLLATVRSVASTGVGVLYVTHRLDEIFGLVDNLTVLRDGKKVAERPVAGLNHRDVISLLIGMDPDELIAEGVDGLPVEEQQKLSSSILQVRSLTADRIRGASFDARPGEVLGIAGITGSGREGILSAIFGGVPRTSGEVHVNGKPIPPHDPLSSVAAGVAHLPSDRKVKSGVMNLSASENLMLVDITSAWRWPLMSRKREREQARVWFEKLGVRPADGFNKPLSEFSGGNQQKLLLAKWLRTDPKLVLLDEPTQGVDVGAKAVIYQQLAETAAAGAAVVVSSSDVDELVTVCDRILIMQSGRVASVLTGSEIDVSALSKAILNARDKVA